MNLKKYFEKDKKILVICSQPIDADSLGSGLILAQYLKKLGKVVKVVFPREKRRGDDNFNYLPYFDSIEFIDSREVVVREKFDSLILVDSPNLLQFHDDKKIDKPLIDLSVFSKILHIDHHAGQPEKFGTDIVYDSKVSSTVEIILTELIPDEFIDKNISTLGYAAILGDTGTFQWNCYPSTYRLTGLLVERGAETEIIINRLNFNKDRQYFDLLALAINNTQYQNGLGATFLFLSKEFAEKNNLDDFKLRLIKDIYSYDIARRIPEYPLGFVFTQDTGRPGLIHISARGNDLINKLDLPKFFASLGGNSGGHFNAAGMDFEGNFEDCKEKFLKVLEKAVKDLD